jgi:thiamine biosynthesis lipoprotein
VIRVIRVIRGLLCAVAASIAVTLSVRAAAPAEQRFEFAEPHMGTIVRLVLYAPDRATADAGATRAFGRIRALDDALSDYREASELMQVSRQAGGGPVPAGDDLFRVLDAAQTFAAASDGAFDVTAGPLSLLWREARRRQAPPDPARLAVARALVGREKLELNPRRRTVRLRLAGMQLDVGGIAKGYAADEAAAVLKQCGIRSALVAAGGDIVATAAPPGADGWRVAVASIDGPSHPPAGYLMLHDAAVSTSGDAEQFMVANGVRYSHIFDPRTGQALTGRSSVTVLAPSGTSSDALATAVSVLGGKRGTRLVDETPGAAALIVEQRADDRVRTHESRRWRAMGGFPVGTTK